MNAVTISTKLYHREMTSFFKQSCIKICQKGDIYFFIINPQHFCCDILAELLEDIILDNNPIVRSSHRIYQRMKEIIFIGERPVLQKDLQVLLAQNETLHIEGYIQFRMQKYENKVNNILYAIVKRSLCGV